MKGGVCKYHEFMKYYVENTRKHMFQLLDMAWCCDDMDLAFPGYRYDSYPLLTYRIAQKRGSIYLAVGSHSLNR